MTVAKTTQDIILIHSNDSKADRTEYNKIYHRQNWKINWNLVVD
jgi:hypothetical protein